METNHTKGNWIVINSGGSIQCNEKKICVLETVPLKITEEVYANAKLISAAPDLLYALQFAYQIIDRLSEDYAMVAGKHANFTIREDRIIKQAIEKAINQ